MPISSRRQRVVLASLLLRPGEVVPVGTLAEAVWPERQPKNPENQIAICVHELRRRFADRGVTGGLIVTEFGGYSVRVARESVDLFAIRARAARADELERAGRPHEAVEQYRTALAGWHGTLLQGLDVPALEPEVLWWQEKRLEVSERCLRLELALGRHRDVLSELAALVAAHPVRESLRGMLMTALYRSGRQVEALQTYLAAQKTLRTTVGIDPSPALRSLYLDILNDTVPGPRADASRCLVRSC
ncbi:AfsR/SARP family transcriptional regulator [Streptoalloteichus tenebrarius]|nr:AfsR/SARP family transcriptional regulator [Streptoalloteichus tenebrarius]